MDTDLREVLPEQDHEMPSDLSSSTANDSGIELLNGTRDATSLYVEESN